MACILLMVEDHYSNLRFNVSAEYLNMCMYAISSVLIIFYGNAMVWLIWHITCVTGSTCTIVSDRLYICWQKKYFLIVFIQPSMNRYKCVWLYTDSTWLAKSFILDLLNPGMSEYHHNIVFIGDKYFFFNLTCLQKFLNSQNNENVLPVNPSLIICFGFHILETRITFGDCY